MSFSKTNSLPLADPAPRYGMFGTDDADASGAEKALGRFEALRDLMNQWLETTIAIANAMRENEVVPLPGFTGELLADVSPLDIRPLEENFTVADKIDLILKLTSGSVALKFTELFTTAASRSEIVITFLALLELIRLKQLRCVQPEAFGEIEISRV